MKFIQYTDNRKKQNYIPITSILSIKFIDDNIKGNSVISIIPISNIISTENTIDLQLKYKIWDKYYEKVKKYFLKNS